MMEVGSMGRGGKTTKSQTPNTKLQTNLKLQYSMTKTQNRFGISNFGHCDLFDICDLLFGVWDLQYEHYHRRR